MKGINIETKAKNLLMRNGATEDIFLSEDKIEQFITSYIYEHDKEFGKYSIYGWGKGCSEWLVSKAPNKLNLIDDCVSTKRGTEYLKKLSIIKSRLASTKKEDKNGWFVLKETAPVKDGWYVVLTSQKNYVDTYSYYRKSNVTCSMYKNGCFSLDHVVAWRILPNLDSCYEYELIKKSESMEA